MLRGDLMRDSMWWMGLRLRRSDKSRSRISKRTTISRIAASYFSRMLCMSDVNSS